MATGTLPPLLASDGSEVLGDGTVDLPVEAADGSDATLTADGTEVELEADGVETGEVAEAADPTDTGDAADALAAFDAHMLALGAEWFGISAFRPGQALAIRNVLTGKIGRASCRERCRL